MRSRPAIRGFAKEMRRQLTLPEAMLWAALKGKKAGGLRFRRQHPIGNYILDFFCVDRNLAVEIDGQGHYHPVALAHDAERDAWLNRRGIRVLRFPAPDVIENLDGAVELIVMEAGPAVSRPRERHWL